MGRDEQIEAAARTLADHHATPDGLGGYRCSCGYKYATMAVTLHQAAAVLDAITPEGPLAYDETLDAEWQRVKRLDIAVRWVLVHIFGTERRYHHDAEFHARVKLAERILREVPGE